MIVDLREQTNRVYFNGIKPKYNAFRMSLVSRYNNKEINNDEFGFINLSSVDTGDSWYSFTYSSDISSLQSIELNDYYDCILYGLDINDTSYEIQRVLCKVLNNFNTDNPDVNYISNNEDNEQYVYFIND